jgi:hypothetical protein
MIQDFKDIHKGETALIVGNGPSLSRSPLFRLSDRYKTFGANKIYEFPFVPNYWACGDSLMLHDCIPWVIAHPDVLGEKFVPRDVPLRGSNLMTLEIKTGFSRDAATVIYMGGTISYINMQLAYYMGFTRLLLVGMDHKYNVAQTGKPGSKFIADGADPDHFGNGYFTPGKIYNRPELEATERYFYPLAKREFESIINLSEETELTVFERDKAENWI